MALIFACGSITPSLAQKIQIKDFIVAIGQCEFQLTREAKFIPCDNKVAYFLLGNGRSTLSFFEPQGNGAFTLAGGHDRQPNLENYYLSIDTLRIKLPNRNETVDNNMEGECHFLVFASGRFRSIHCDVYDRHQALSMKFYLENISNTDIKIHH